MMVHRAMTVILDQVKIPESGIFEIHQIVQINVSATQAKRLANRYLLNEVSYMLIADLPDLVINGRAVWRAPVWIGFARHGRTDLGVLTIDAESGDFVNVEAETAELRVRAAAATVELAPYTPVTEIPSEYVATNLPEYSYLAPLPSP